MIGAELAPWKRGQDGGRVKYDGLETIPMLSMIYIRMDLPHLWSR
jgi:hypothetical protein